jgi:hypothetical protein
MAAARPRSSGALLAVVALAGCGGDEPLHEGRTAAQWTQGLSMAPDHAKEAMAALAEMARRHPDEVLGALEEALLEEKPPTVGAPFSIELDPAAAARLGLPPLPPNEASHLDLPAMRARLDSLALPEAVTIVARADGQFHFTLSARPRAEVEWIQAVLAERGAFELAFVVGPDEPGVGRHEGATAFEDLVADEVRRFVGARAAKVPYEPSDRRWRVAPRHGTPASEPAHFVAVRTPQVADEAFTEAAVASARTASGPDGPSVAVAALRPERREHLRAATARSVGGKLAFLWDETVRAVDPISAPLSDALSLDPARLGLAHLKARGLAAVLSSGRLPRPVRPLPLPPGLGEAPPADTPVARAFVAVGEVAIPVLERVRSSGDAPAHARASAAWAIERIREKRDG